MSDEIIDLVVASITKQMEEGAEASKREVQNGERKTEEKD